MDSEPVKSNKKTITTVIVVGLLLVGGVGVSLYMQDSKTVQEAKGYKKSSVALQEARIVRAYIVNFCMEYARYPKHEEFAKKFPKLAADPDWSYRPGKDFKSGTLQYPPPLFSTSGDNGTVSNPCQVFNTEVF